MTTALRIFLVVMIACFCAAFWSPRFLLYATGPLYVPNLIWLLVICLVTEVTLFAVRQKQTPEPTEPMRRRLCHLLYIFALVIADPWTTVAAIGYAAGLRLSERRPTVAAVHVLGVCGIASALLTRKLAMFEQTTEAPFLRVVDLVACATLAAGVLSFVVWQRRRLEPVESVVVDVR